MDKFEEVKTRYLELVSARSVARSKARDEYREAIDRRVSELVELEEAVLLRSIVSAHESGATPNEIQVECFPGNPLVWSELRKKAGLPDSRRGRKAGELQHGKNGTYNRGCRCEPCSDAAREYQREYLRRKKGN